MRTSHEINQEMEAVNKERARLATDRPDGWTEEYHKMQDKITELAKEFSAAASAEEMTEWYNGWEQK